MLTREDLMAIFPRPKGETARAAWDGYVTALASPEGAALLSRYGITTPLRLVHLLATWGAETNLSLVWESGAYSAAAIVRNFGPARHSARIMPAEAQRIAALPIEERTRVLFERAYGSGNPKKAKELGNTQPGDGWRFRGFSLNQLTGREAHTKAAARLGCTLEQLWTTPLLMLEACLLEWQDKNCNLYADADDAVSIRKLINGGSLRVSIARINGLPQARQAVARAKLVITADDFESAAARAEGAGSAPLSMWQSTEAQIAAGIGGTGGTMGAKSIGLGLKDALQSMFAKGQFSLTAFLGCAVEQDEIWAGIGMILLFVGGAAYWWLKRRRNLYLHGV